MLSNLIDIKRYDKVDNPNVHYLRSTNYIFSLAFGEGKNRFSWIFSVGSKFEWKVRTSMPSKKSRPSLQWYISIIKVFVEVFSVEQSFIRFGDMDIWQKAVETYQFPLGLINYFANDFHIKIPDNLPHVIYEQMPNGKLFYLPSEDINAAGESFDKLVNNLFEVMAALKDASPNYGKAV